MRILILGGTSEASALAGALAGAVAAGTIAATLSLAGRTQNPVAPPIPFRTGGFGGVAGLIAYLAEHRIDAVVDATHPFAARISANASAACRASRLPLIQFTRPRWQHAEADRWTGVPDMAAAARALGAAPRRVFLTVGGLQLVAFAAAPQHHYLVRTIEPPPGIATLPHHRLVLARGPFTVDAETALMREAGIEVIVTKNSGAQATAAKLVAARSLGIDVIMVERPAPEAVRTCETLDAVLAWIEHHRPAP